jgi:hypothetical protein
MDPLATTPTAARGARAETSRGAEGSSPLPSSRSSGLDLRYRWSSMTGVCDCRLFAFAIGPVAGVGRRVALSVERDDDLAVGAALLDVGERLEGLVERECLVDERAEVAGVIQGGQLAQLPAVGPHEQKRVGAA